MLKDIIIIGGGPGGYVAAIRAAKLGADVCLIEKDKLGGTCLNRGCIPTKALYKNAEAIHTVKESETFGISIDSYKLNVASIQDRKQSVVNKLVAGVEQLLKGNKIEVINGTAKLINATTAQVVLEDGSTQEVTAKNIILATGSTPTIPPIEGSQLKNVVTTEELLNFTEIPEKMVIIGGGVVGMEFAGIFNAFGSEVTVIEFLPNILNQVDSNISKKYKSIAKKQGINIITSAKVTKIEEKEDELLIFYEDKKGEHTVLANQVLLSTGRKPNLQGLGLDEVGITYDKKGIEVNDQYETNVKGVYAIGDVNGKIMLAHAASHQGEAVVEAILTNKPIPSSDIIPSCIFVFPEIAIVGLSEDEAKEKGIEVLTSKFMFSANGKALALNEDDGLVKVVADKATKTVLGVHILGPHASDLIHEGALAIQNKLTVDEIKHTVHAHPTLGEAFYEAVLGITDEAIHMLTKKRR